MSDKLLISDANIIIDLVAGNLISEMFQLPHEFGTATTLYHDELADFYPDLLEQGLQLLELAEDAITRAQQLGQQYKGVSSYDVEALALAEQEQAPLLTGDGKLRQVGLEAGVDIRGTLWLIEQMMVHELISVDQTETAYNRMEEEGSRLPWDLVEQQLNRFR